MKLFLQGILLLAFASFAPLAFGGPDWTNTGPDTNYNNGLNWTTDTAVGTIPGPGDSAHVFPGFTTFANGTMTDITVQGGGSLIVTINSTTNQSVGAWLASSNFDSISESGGVLNLNFTGGSTYNIGTGGAVYTGSVLVNFAGNQNITGDFVIGTTSSTIDPGQVTGGATLNLGAGTTDMDSGFANTLTVGSGTNGAVVQNMGSIVTTGEGFVVGTNGGAGTYTLNANAALNIGTTGAPLSNSYQVIIGSGSGSSGTLAMVGSSVLTATNAGTTFVVGAGSSGIMTENGTSIANIGGLDTEIGLAGTGLVQLQDNSALNITSDSFLIGAGGVGTLTQADLSTLSVGAGTATSIGSSGTGAYTFTGGTADFQDGFSVGVGTAGSSGTVTQSGSSTLTTEGIVTVGGATGTGAGTYLMQGGNATFNAGLIVGATGAFTQTGGMVVIPTGETLDVSAAGSAYNLGGSGILQVTNGALVGTAGQNNLNLSGGTLQVGSAGAFTDPLNSTLSGTSTIDAVTTTGVTSVTMSGNLSGTGGITFLGATGTTFQFTGTNTYTGATTITSGILNANASAIASSSSLGIGTAGVLNLTLANGGFAYAGALSGTGALNVNFAAAGDGFSILNAGSYTGPITLGANGTSGKLQVYSGTFGNIGDGGSNSGVTIGGAPLSPFPAGTAVPTTGVVTLGNNSYTGLTTVSSGFTLYADSIGGAVQNNGTLGIPLSSPVGSTLNINGALNVTSGVLAIRVTGSSMAPVADLIQTTGAATIDAASGFQITGAGNVSTPVPILTATGGLTVAPAALQDLTGSILFKPTLTVVGNSIDLTAVQTPLGTFAITPNESAAAAPIDLATTNLGSLPASQAAALSNLLLGFNKFTTPAQIAAGLEQVTPQSLQYARNIAFENSNFLAQRVNGVDTDIRAGYGGLDTSAFSLASPGFDSGLGRSLGNLLAYNDPGFHQAAPNGVNYYPDGSSDGSSLSPKSSSAPQNINTRWDSSNQVISDSPNPYLANQHPSGPEVPAISEFIGGDVVLADLNKDQSLANAPSSKANYTAGDASAGVSFRMTSKLAAGVLFDYNHTDANTDNIGSKTKVDTYSPGIFATYFDHGFYANGLFSFGYNEYENTRSVPVDNNAFASSSPKGEQYVGDLDFGYDFHPDKSWIFGPTLGLTYTHLDIDSFTETGAPGADLAVDSQSADSFRSRLGGHVVFQTNTGDVLLQPNFTAMWQHEYLDDSSGITSSFNDFGSNSFTINTAAPSRDSALIGLGMTATLSNSMALYLNYIADVGASDYFAQSVIGGFKARF